RFEAERFAHRGEDVPRASEETGVHERVARWIEVLELVAVDLFGVERPGPGCIRGAGEDRRQLRRPPARSGESAAAAPLLDRRPGEPVDADVDPDVAGGASRSVGGNAVQECVVDPIATREERERDDHEAPHSNTPIPTSGPP